MFSWLIKNFGNDFSIIIINSIPSVRIEWILKRNFTLIRYIKFPS